MKPHVKGGLLAALILMLLIVLAAVLLFRPGGGTGTTARISLDGQVVEELDLSTLDSRWERTFTGSSGLSNRVVAEDGKIWVEEAGCPDQVCVKQGPAGITPVICLPNKLIIELVEGGEQLDAQAG